MLDFIQNNSLEIVKYYLQECTPESVFTLMASGELTKFRAGSIEDADELENFLHGLSRPLINLGLACYGQNKDVVRSLYQSAAPEVGLAVLGRADACKDLKQTPANVFTGNEVEALLLKGNPSEQRALLQNKHLSPDIFYKCFGKLGGFSSIGDEDFQALVRSSIGNSQFITSSTNGEWHSNYTGYTTEGTKQVLSSAWNLSATVPVVDSWAITLMGLYENLLRIGDLKIDVESVIARWQGPAQNEENADAYDSVRMHIADFIEINSDAGKSLRNSEDSALRCSFYKRFIPESYSELEELYAHDKEKFVFWALANSSILRDNRLAEELGKLCSKEDSSGSFYREIFDQRMGVAE